MAKDRDTVTIEDINKAKEWRDNHSHHVSKLVDSVTISYPPSGSDRGRPELWKAEHWKWLENICPAQTNCQPQPGNRNIFGVMLSLFKRGY